MPQRLDRENMSTLAQHAAALGVDPRHLPVQYEADGQRRNWIADAQPGRYRNARFMPRAASRIMLEIAAVRIERLGCISVADAAAEGVAPAAIDAGAARDAYARLWDSLHGADAWRLDPWIWVVEFNIAGGRA